MTFKTSTLRCSPGWLPLLNDTTGSNEAIEFGATTSALVCSSCTSGCARKSQTCRPRLTASNSSWQTCRSEPLQTKVREDLKVIIDEMANNSLHPLQMRESIGRDVLQFESATC